MIGYEVELTIRKVATDGKRKDLGALRTVIMQAQGKLPRADLEHKAQRLANQIKLPEAIK